MSSPVRTARRLRLSTAAALGALALLLAGCPASSPPDSDPGGPTGDAPTVLDHSPDDGATDVPLNQNIVVRFSDAMDAPATEAAVATDPALSCSFGWNPDGDRLTCDPDADMSANTEYEVTVGTGARAASGTDMASAASFAFRTGTTTAPQCTFGASEFGACVFAP